MSNPYKKQNQEKNPITCFPHEKKSCAADFEKESSQQEVQTSNNLLMEIRE